MHNTNKNSTQVIVDQIHYICVYKVKHKIRNVTFLILKIVSFGQFTWNIKMPHNGVLRNCSDIVFLPVHPCGMSTNSDTVWFYPPPSVWTVQLQSRTRQQRRARSPCCVVKRLICCSKWISPETISTMIYL